MKHSFFFISISLLCLFCSCKKNNNESEQKKDQFSFVYNGVTYNYNVINNVANAAVIKRGNHTAGIMIDMPAIFGGRIYFTEATVPTLNQAIP